MFQLPFPCVLSSSCIVAEPNSQMQTWRFHRVDGTVQERKGQTCVAKNGQKLVEFSFWFFLYHQNLKQVMLQPTKELAHHGEVPIPR